MRPFTFIFITLLTFLSFANTVKAQDEPLIDTASLSINDLHTKLELLATSHNHLMRKMARMEGIEYDLDSGLEAMQEQERKKLIAQFENRQQKIIRMADFLQSANNSVNALMLSNTLTSYLNDVSALNNPTNKDLGFSLADEVVSVMEEKILKGKGKFAGQKANRFVGFVKGMINNPVTSAVTGMLPVVSSITSVTGMVAGAAFSDKKIEPTDVTAFSEEIKTYVQHYEGLAGALYEFNLSTVGIHERLKEVQVQLSHILLERVNTLYPDLKMTEEDLLEAGLTDVIYDYYNTYKMEELLDGIIGAYVKSDSFNMEVVLKDPQLFFPGFEIDRASMINDVIDVLANESINALQQYQSDIEEVLEQTKNAGIGDPAKIDYRIAKMREKLKEVVSSFDNAVHLKDVQNKFYRLAATDQEHF